MFSNVKRAAFMVAALAILILAMLVASPPASADVIQGYTAVADVRVPGQVLETWQVTGVVTVPTGVGPVSALDCARAAAVARLSSKGTIVTGPTVSLSSPFVGTTEQKLK